MAAVADRPRPALRRGSAPAQLVGILGALRDEGLPFELAWEAGLERVVWPRSQRETLEWLRALDATKATWRARYEGWQPTPSELAVAGLAEILAARGL